MELKSTELRFLFLPLTPRGVAAYSQAGFGRLVLVQLCVALLSGMTLLWFCEKAWFPTLKAAMAALPDEGEIRDGKLQWSGRASVMLGSGNHLSLAVNLDHSTPLGGAAHVRVEFGTNEASICSLLGCVQVGYPRGWRVGFNRAELEPWWGARQGFIRAMIVLVTAAAIQLVWFALSVVYTLPVWGAAVLSNRELSLFASGRVAGAALMPGAFVMLLAIVLYGLGVFDLVHFLLGVTLHLIVGWGYLAAGLLFLPRGAGAATPGNPFGGSQTAEPKSRDNPFHPPGKI